MACSLEAEDRRVAHPMLRVAMGPRLRAIDELLQIYSGSSRSWTIAPSHSVLLTLPTGRRGRRKRRTWRLSKLNWRPLPSLLIPSH
jgi:hypothetical protein